MVWMGRFGATGTDLGYGMMGTEVLSGLIEELVADDVDGQ